MFVESPYVQFHILSAKTFFIKKKKRKIEKKKKKKTVSPCNFYYNTTAFSVSLKFSKTRPEVFV